MTETKPFTISKNMVWEAYKKIKANKGAAGVDGKSIKDFEKDVKDNLYKIWNRMSSGCYFPPPVKRVEIPKPGGKKRPLGIPTVGDRIAQMVVKMYLEPEVDKCFHPDSYGYRPSKSAHGALETTRKRCWEYDWVIDIDIKGFFDNIDHELMMKAVRKHTDTKWLLLYIERWLKVSVEMPDGNIMERTKGTPQGGVISPLLANIFLHHAFDEWMRKRFFDMPFERYADDIIVHCDTQKQAEYVRDMIAKRLKSFKLELNPEKTKIVYCKDGDRKKDYPDIDFDFLGYTFRPRKSKDKNGRVFLNFSPAVSRKSLKSMSDVIKSWNLHRRSNISLEEMAKKINPVMRGWINYYCKYYKTAFTPILGQLYCRQLRWVENKYKLRSRNKAKDWLFNKMREDTDLFVFWGWWLGKMGITRAV